MIKLLLQTTNIIQDVNFDEAIGLSGSFKRVRTDRFPLEETIKAISSSDIKNVICFGDIIDDYNVIQRIILESKAFKKNLYMIVSKTDFKESALNEREWLVSNSDEILEIEQYDTKATLKTIEF